MDEFRLRILEKISEAALDDGLWEEIVDDLRAHLSGSHGIIFTPDIDPTSSGGLWMSRTLSPTDVEQYLEYYHTKDLWTLRGLETGTIKTGRAFVGQEIVSEKEFVETEFYQDFMRELESKNLITATIFDGNGDIPRVMMSVFAGNQSTPYDETALQFYNSIISRVQNSIALRHKFNAFEDQARSFEFVFNAIEQPAFLVNHAGRLIAVNQAAESFIETNDDFQVRGRLLCWCPRDQKSLDAALAMIAETGSEDAGSAIAISIKSKQSPRPYILDIRTVPGSREVNGRTPCALICISADRPPDRARVAAVCDFYDLTRAEKALCLRLLDGHSLKMSAELLGVTEGTARQRLKTVFSKTQTHSQAALISLFQTF